MKIELLNKKRYSLIFLSAIIVLVVFSLIVYNYKDVSANDDFPKIPKLHISTNSARSF